MSRTLAALVNPSSGKGRSAKHAPIALDMMRNAGIEVLELVGSDAQDAVRIAREAVTQGVDGLIAVGGDGTVHLALQAIGTSGTPLGVIPLGTGDDNARSIGVPIKDVPAAVQVIIRGETRTMDLARAQTADGTQRYFLGVLSAGFDSNVNERANLMTWPSGQARYIRAILAELRTFKPVPYQVEFAQQIGGETELIATNGMLVAVGNGTSYGGGMQICPSAVDDDGLLDITFLGEVGKPTFLRVFPTVFKGTHVEHPTVSTYRAASIRISAPDQVAYADGERIGPLPVEIEVLPAGLRVFGSN